MSSACIHFFYMHLTVSFLHALAHILRGLDLGDHIKPYDNLVYLLFFWLGSDGARVERWLDELALAIFYSWMVTIFGNLLEKGVNFI